MTTITTTYQPIYQQLVSHLDPSLVLIGKQINTELGHDELNTFQHLPDLVVKPQSTEQVALVMRLATQYQVPVTARGAGTGLVGGCVPIEGGLLIDLTSMNQIIELDTENLTLTTQAGALLKDVAAYATNQGYLYAPDPGEKAATIGGNIATNAGGMRAVKYGTTRDSVRALTVVTAQGKILELGSKVVKNSSGLDLKDLFIGSEGVLGIITEATLQIRSLPKASASLLIPFDNFETALSAVPKILRSGTQPTAVEFFEADTIKCWEAFANQSFPQAGAAVYLLLTVDGQQSDVVTTDYEKIAELCLDQGAIDVYVLDTDVLKKQIWSARDAFLEAIKASTTTMDEADAVVPRSATTEFVAFTHQLAAEEHVRIPSFGHVGDGNLHLYICQDDYDDDTWKFKLTTIFKALYDKAIALNGKISGEHGIGYAKRPYLQAASSPAELAIMQAIKAALDPDSLLNPDKIF
ncbi:dehydrogenase [Lactobacillus backii] [Lactiplantibacillus mudanjiangensis]|uniref:FAD-binding oxidoreductase n=1 Tax=Lactiplantibacillus mudanjiangensis TaxID=1296538 RepID=UPI0010140B9B|nr:FAD-binding oxidoreductase [Lactiplantibacillus mudanjiangensis]VDG32019.1 dehydrogenase [Lactobacillus backii] [Lactiplantibacillus mudanjiangensis]